MIDLQKLKSDISKINYDEMDIAPLPLDEIGIMLTGNDAQALLNAAEALEKLVRAKLIKDFEGETEEYRRLKDQAWFDAFTCFNTKDMVKEQADKLNAKINELSKISSLMQTYIQ